MESIREICVATEPPSPEPAAETTTVGGQRPARGRPKSAPYGGGDCVESKAATMDDRQVDRVTDDESGGTTADFKSCNSTNSCSNTNSSCSNTNNRSCSSRTDDTSVSSVISSSPVRKGCGAASVEGRKRTLSSTEIGDCQRPLFNSNSAALHWLSPDRGNRHTAVSGGRHLAVSPPKLGAGHVAYKLFKKCPTQAAAADDPWGGDNQQVSGEQEKEEEWRTESGRHSSDRKLVHGVRQLVVATSLSTRTRRKSQLADAPLLKRSRSTMRQELSLPLLNTSSVSKENCDSQRVSPVAATVANFVPVLPLTTFSVRPEEAQLDAAADTSGGQVPSRVLRDRNAEKGTSQETWHR